MIKRIKKIAAVLLCTVLLADAMSFSYDLRQMFGITASADDTEGTENFNVPKNGEEIRDLAEQHIKEMVNVKWTCAETIDFSQSTDWTGTLIYKAGVQFKGVPYVSNRMDGDSDVYEFSESLDENGVYTGPVSWQSMIGSDCGGAPRLAFAWSGALYKCSAGNDFSYEPLRENLAKGLKPLGDYEWEAYDSSKSQPNIDTIMAASGEEKIYECYSLLREGDVVWALFRVNESSLGEHIRFVISDAVTKYNSDGSINPRKSYIRIIEQTSMIFENTDGTCSTWRTKSYTFRELYVDGYIPYTMEAYSKTSVEYPEFSTEDVNISGSVDMYDLMSGRINCNYNIFGLEAVISDENGNTVTTGISYPYTITADLSKMKFSVPLSEVAAGKYHYTLKATIGYGEKILVDTDITFSGAGDPVIFISDDGTGNGSSPENALGNAEGYYDITGTSFKNSALYRAVAFLSQTGGTIVVCGKISIISGHYYGISTLSDFTIPGLPVEDVTIKLTSVYDGVDYRDNGASITFERTNRMIPQLELKINTVWDDIDLIFKDEYGTWNQTVIACGNKKTVFGENVRIRVFYDGEEIENPESAFNYFPIVCGGYRYSVDPGNTDLTVLGGIWRAVVGGPCGVDSLYHGILDGSTSVTVGGNAVVYGGIYGGSYDTCGSVSGDIDINITGGSVKGDIVLAGNGGVTGEKVTATLAVTGNAQVTGTVKTVGPSAKHNAPANTVLDFSGAESGAALPSYEAADFTELDEIPASPETEALDETQNGKETQNTSSGEKDSEGMGATVIAVICAAAVLIAAGAVFIIIKMKKRG